jgi:bifunctional ADP-heptose synthase (sugar kinase/adenylyltransferase)
VVTAGLLRRFCLSPHSGACRVLVDPKPRHFHFYRGATW